MKIRLSNTAMLIQVLFTAFLLVTTIQLDAQQSKSGSKLTADQINEEEAYAIGIQAAVWGRPLVEYNKTIYAGAKAGAAYTNYFRRYDNLKTAADRFVVTPNNVTIDAYANADLSLETGSSHHSFPAEQPLVYFSDKRCL